MPWRGRQEGRAAGRAGVRRAAKKLPRRLSARARGRRSPPRAVCSGSVPCRAGTTSNREEPGRCLQEGTGAPAVPSEAGHPRCHHRHLTSYLGGQQCPGPPQDWCWFLRDDGTGTMQRACPAMPCPAPRGAPSVPALLRLLAPSLLHASHVSPRAGWGGLAPDGANWDPVLILVRPSCPVPLVPAPCPLFGCCSRLGVRQITAHPGSPRPCPAWGSCPQDGCLGSQPPPASPCCCRVIMGCGTAVTATYHP